MFIPLKQAGGLYDYLSKTGRKASYGKERKQLAEQAGISNYKGTAEQNIALQRWLMQQDGQSSAYNKPPASAYEYQSLDDIRPLNQPPSQYSDNYENDMQIFNNRNVPQNSIPPISQYSPLSPFLQEDPYSFLKKKKQFGGMNIKKFKGNMFMNPMQSQLYDPMNALTDMIGTSNPAFQSVLEGMRNQSYKNGGAFKQLKMGGKTKKKC